MNPRVVFSSLFAWVSAIMLGMAAGAVWMVPTLYMQRALPALAIPAGWLLGKAMRTWVRPPGLHAALLAALAMLLAALYVNVLMAAARIAGLMGLGLIDVLHTAGVGLLVQLADLGHTSADSVWYAIGVGLAAVTAFRASRQPKTGG